MRIATSELAASAGMAIKNEARPISGSSAVHASVVRRVTRPSGATLAERSAVLRADSVGGLGYRRRSSAPRTSKTTLGYARAAAVAPRVASGPSRDSREADTQRSAESRVPRADGAESGPTPRCLRGSNFKLAPGGPPRSAPLRLAAAAGRRSQWLETGAVVFVRCVLCTFTDCRLQIYLQIIFTALSKYSAAGVASSLTTPRQVGWKSASVAHRSGARAQYGHLILKQVWVVFVGRHRVGVNRHAGNLRSTRGNKVSVHVFHSRVALDHLLVTLHFLCSGEMAFRRQRCCRVYSRGLLVLRKGRVSSPVATFEWQRCALLRNLLLALLQPS